MINSKRFFRVLSTLFCVLPSLTYAGGFDNTARQFNIIFDAPGKQNELRFEYQSVHPDIKGNIQQILGDGTARHDVSGVAPDYSHNKWGLRLQLNDATSCAARYETPYRTDTRYQDDRYSYQSDNSDPSSQVYSALDSYYDSQSLTFACRYTWSNNSHRLHVFGGPKHQQINGAFSSDLTSFSLGQADNLNVYLDGHSEWGYIAGIGFEIPSIAARIALTYHSEISYDLTGTTFTPSAGFAQRIVADATASTRTPQAINLNMKTGIAEGWLLFSDISWAEWGNVQTIDVQDGIGNPGLTLFTNDTLDFALGVAHTFNERMNIGASYSTGIKLGSDTNPPGIDGPDLRNPLGDTHTFSIGADYKLTESLSTDFVINTIILEEKRILEQRAAGDVYLGEFERSTALSFALGLSWFFDQ